jgi:hypothetical protein
MNFTVTSKGRQFDRLALMYFNDTEVWRTSTAEPTTAGIRWEYVKDMSEYLSLWKQPQKLIFDLGNLIDSTYTGKYNTTLTATFFTSQDTVTPADLIIPISKRLGSEDKASLFTVPADNATNTVSLPRNANRAVFSLSACGQATEEFWWGNVLQSDALTFADADTTLYGYSPFREVQLYIDGQLAGVQWPFPVIFTGGVIPGLWRPIVGIDAFDLKETEIDITPWLPLLSDGNDHVFTIKVAGLLDDGNTTATITETVGSSWYVTGKIFLWLDGDESSVTTGTTPSILLPNPTISVSQTVTQNSTGANSTLVYNVNVKRTLSVSATVISQNGTNYAGWTQDLTFDNGGVVTDDGNTQVVNSTTTGTDQATGNFYYKAEYTFPAFVNDTYAIVSADSTNFTIEGVVDYGKVLSIFGNSIFPTGLQPFAALPASASLVSGFSGTRLETRENGTAYYFGSPATGTATGFGSTSQELKFVGLSATDAVDTELYYRNVEAVNTTIVHDTEILVGNEVGRFTATEGAHSQAVMQVALKTLKEALGRGPQESV